MGFDVTIMDNTLFSIFQIFVLVFSAVIHEVSHGYAALAMGDETAKIYGRLTLNPLKHLDPVGSVLLPLLFFLLPGGFMFAYAKPVPFNPRNLSDQKYGSAKVALAGPASNLVLATIFGLVIRFGVAYLPDLFLRTPLLFLLLGVVFINIMLAIFNLIPIPPLDGSKLLFTFVPYRYRGVEAFLQQWGMFILLFLMFSGSLFGTIMWPIVMRLATLMTGISQAALMGGF